MSLKPGDLVEAADKFHEVILWATTDGVAEALSDANRNVWDEKNGSMARRPRGHGRGNRAMHDRGHGHCRWNDGLDARAPPEEVAVKPGDLMKSRDGWEVRLYNFVPRTDKGRLPAFQSVGWMPERTVALALSAVDQGWLFVLTETYAAWAHINDLEKVE